MILRRFAYACIAATVLIVTIVDALGIEKSAWVEVEGEAYQSDVSTPREVKERARRDAERRAIEKAEGIFIHGQTLISNSQVAEDLIYAAVQGTIEKSEVIHEGWDAKDRRLYRVRLKALVAPQYPEHGGMSLKLSLSKAELTEGEAVQIFYESDRKCYVYLFSVATDGSVTLLFPNRLHRDNFVQPGRAYTFPPDGSSVQLKAAFLPGHTGSVVHERIKLIATTSKQDLLPLGFQEGIFTVYDAHSTGMIADLVRRLSMLPPEGWREATIGYRIIRTHGSAREKPR